MTLKIRLALLCLLLNISAVGLPQICGANFFMKEIIINSRNGDKHTIQIDDDDFERVSKIAWYANNVKGKPIRIVATPPEFGSKHIILSRFIIGFPNGLFVDHKDRNPLNNCKSNLRICTHAQNNCNRSIQKGNTKGIKSVATVKRKNGPDRYVASISLNNTKKHIGTFDTEKQAALAYNEAAKKYYGEYANLNKV